MTNKQARGDHIFTCISSDYLRPPNITCSSDAQQLISSIIDGISNRNDWNAQFDSLPQLQALAKYHPDIVRERLDDIIPGVVKCCANMRSSVARNGFLTVGRLAWFLSNPLKDHLDELLPLLVAKAASATQRFLAEAAWESLMVLCSGSRVIEGTLINLAKALNNKSNAVVNVVAKLLFSAVNAAKSNNILSNKIIKTVLPPTVNLMDMRTATAKEAGNRIFSTLCRVWHGRLLSEGLSAAQAKQKFSQQMLPLLNSAQGAFCLLEYSLVMERHGGKQSKTRVPAKQCSIPETRSASEASTCIPPSQSEGLHNQNDDSTKSHSKSRAYGERISRHIKERFDAKRHKVQEKLRHVGSGREMRMKSRRQTVGLPDTTVVESGDTSPPNPSLPSAPPDDPVNTSRLTRRRSTLPSVNPYPGGFCFPIQEISDCDDEDDDETKSSSGAFSFTSLDSLLSDDSNSKTRNIPQSPTAMAGSGIKGAPSTPQLSCQSVAWNALLQPNVSSDEDAEHMLIALMKSLSDDKWKVQCDALTKVQAIAKYHPDVVSDHLDPLLKDVIYCCKSSEDSVARNGIITIGRLALCSSISIVNRLDEVFHILVVRSADNTQKILAEAAWESAIILCSGHRLTEYTFVSLAQSAGQSLKDPSVAAIVSKLCLVSLDEVRVRNLKNLNALKALIPLVAEFLEYDSELIRQFGREIACILFDSWFMINQIHAISRADTEIQILSHTKRTVSDFWVYRALERELQLFNKQTSNELTVVGGNNDLSQTPTSSDYRHDSATEKCRPLAPPDFPQPVWSLPADPPKLRMESAPSVVRPRRVHRESVDPIVASRTGRQASKPAKEPLNTPSKGMRTYSCDRVQTSQIRTPLEDPSTNVLKKRNSVQLTTGISASEPDVEFPFQRATQRKSQSVAPVNMNRTRLYSRVESEIPLRTRSCSMQSMRGHSRGNRLLHKEQRDTQSLLSPVSTGFVANRSSRSPRQESSLETPFESSLDAKASSRRTRDVSFTRKSAYEQRPVKRTDLLAVDPAKFSAEVASLRDRHTTYRACESCAIKFEGSPTQAATKLEGFQTQRATKLEGSQTQRATKFEASQAPAATKLEGSQAQGTVTRLNVPRLRSPSVGRKEPHERVQLAELSPASHSGLSLSTLRSVKHVGAKQRQCGAAPPPV